MQWLEDNNLLHFQCRKAPNSKDDKTPFIKKWQEINKLKKYKQDDTKRIGLLTGEKNRITVIDIDTHDNGFETWKQLLKIFDTDGVFEKTPRVKTLRDGIHYYMQYDPEIKTTSKIVKRLVNGKFEKVGIDSRNDGGYVCCPSGDGDYKFIKKYDITELQLIPIWLKNAIKYGIRNKGDTIKILTEYDRLKNLSTKELKIDTHFPVSLSNSVEKEHIREMVMALSFDRCDIFSDWVRVVYALGSISKTEKIDLLDVAKEWSAQSSKYDEHKVESVYNKADNKFTIGSLWYWLKEDNLEIYHNIIEKHNRLHGVKYFFEDYANILNEYKTNNVVPMDTVKQYIKDAFAKVLNGGNVCFYSISKSGNIVRVDKNPTKAINFNFKISLDDDAPEFSLTQIFNSMNINGDLTIYDKVDYVPYLIPPTDKQSYLNIFKPFPHKFKKEYSPEQLEKDICKIEPIMKHVRMLCSDDDEIYDYFVKLISHTIQKPVEKPETFCIVIGAMGIGKDCFLFDFMEKILGDWNCVRVSTLAKLLTKFNTDLEGKVWVVVSELQDKENAHCADTLKALITDKKITIEPKGKDKYTVNDCARYIGMGNNRNCVGMSHEDRRMQIWEVLKKKPSTEYFNGLFELLNSGSVQEAFFDVFSHLPIDEFNPRKITNTKFKQELIENSTHHAIRFIHECRFDSNFVFEPVCANNLYNKFKMWAIESGEKNISNKKNFILKLREIGVETKRLSVKKNKIRMAYLDKDVITSKLKEIFKLD